MALKFRDEERRRLLGLIQEWNLNRLDLFALSEPNENLEFFGVMRFFYQDEGEKVSTKCIRVSSTATTGDVIEILVEKFRPDMRMLTRASYSLYEVHVNGEERKLLDHERPLLVQLNWGKDDREGRFLLRKEVERSSSLGRLSSSTGELSTAGSGDSFKRKLSKREKKELKKKEKEEKMRQLASRGSEAEGQSSNPGVAEKLYSELPESSFTRSISNPELVMRKRRQLKLERKLQEMNTPNGTQGGTLKIYGQSVKPDVPYKTLLLTVNDTAADVVAEALEKYGYEREDPENFCLVMVMIPPEGTENNKDLRERILDDDECPLNILLQHPPSKGMIKFHLRLRPPDAPGKRNRNSNNSNYYPVDSQLKSDLQLQQQQQQQQVSFLLPIGPDGRELMNMDKIPVPYGMLEIGRERTRPSDVPFVCLAAPDILPVHCSITRSVGGTTWISPANHDAAAVFVQNQRVRDPTPVSNGQVVQVGKSYFFRYLEGRVPSAIQNSNYGGGGVVVGNNGNYPSKYVGNNSHLRSPSSSSSSRTSNGRLAKNDLETTFDLDGQVMTVPSHGPSSSRVNLTEYSSSGAIQQQSKASPGAPGNLLPANFAFHEGCEEQFLRECVSEVNFAAMQFKMSPSFLIYLATRSMLSSSSSPSTSSETRVARFTARMSQLIAKSVKENTGNPPLLSFWMANSSELKNFFHFDPQLSCPTEQAQLTLMEVIQVAFTSFVDCLKGELEQTLPAIIGAGPDAGEMEAVEDFIIKRLPPKLGNVTHVLTLAMSVLRRCRVNTTMTIFIFSQLFSFISSWVFNCVVLDQRLRLCTSDWGRRLRLRLQQVMMWAEKQGLEKAAECHLAKVMQLCLILECRKADLFQVLSNCDLINSLQLQAILTNYVPGPDEQPLPREVVDRAVRVVASTVDYDIIGEGGQPQLPELLDHFFQVNLVFPREGFSCDSVVGVPPGMLDFIDAFTRSGTGVFSLNPHSTGSWSVYLNRDKSKQDLSNWTPEVIQVTLNKIRNSLGLSIVAAQGDGQREKGIYVKSVVPSGAADLDGTIQTGDQLLEVGGRSLIGVTQERAAEMMSQSGQVVVLKILKKAATYHGLSALLESAQPDSSLQRQQKPATNLDSSRLKVQEPLAPKNPLYSDDKGRGPSTWRQEPVGHVYGEDPYGRLPPRANVLFPSGMTSSHSDPNLIDSDLGHRNPAHLPQVQAHQGLKRFDNGVPFEGPSEVKYSSLGIADQLRNSSSSIQGGSHPAHTSANQNVQVQLVQNGRQDPLYGRLGQGGSNSPMFLPNSVQFPDAPPIKFNPALNISRPPHPSSALQTSGRAPGYATQLLFPKAGPTSGIQQPSSSRASPSLFSQNSSMPPNSSSVQSSLNSQGRNQLSVPSNADYLINNANQSSEIYQSRSQALPMGHTNSGDYDFPPPPLDVQLAQMKISGLAPGQPRPFETIQTSSYESSQLKPSALLPQSEIHPPTFEAAGKKPPPVAAKPKITPADLKSVSLSKSPWDKEAKEKEEEEMMKRKRKDEIRRLENKPYLSQEEQSKLKRLQTEEEFDQRALQASMESQECETPTRQFPTNFVPASQREQQSGNFYSSKDRPPQQQNYGQVQPNQYEPLRQMTSQYNSIGYGQQEELPIVMQGSYDPYRFREESQAPPQQTTRIPGSSALKQLQQLQSDNTSQSSLNTTSSSGMAKKTVTFNENVGINEYPALRSYGSTSSDGSLVHSFDQSFSGNYSDDHSPNSTYQRNAIQATFLPKLIDQDKVMYNIPTSQVSYEYKPRFTSDAPHAQRPPNPVPSYPYRPPQPGPTSQNLQQQAPLTYPYRPPQVKQLEEPPNSRNQPVYGRRHLDPTYAQRTFRAGNLR